MHKIENKSLWKDEMSYGNGTWHMDSTLEELKKGLHLANFHLHYYLGA